MKMALVAGTVLLVSQFLYQAHAIELCEPQDYYNLADSAKCKITNDKTGNKNSSQDAMFEILKNYPYEKRDKFIKVLQRKIELVGNYITQLHGQGQAEKAKAALIKLGDAKQALLGQLEMVNTATRDNWVNVRDQARKVLKETVRNLHGIE